MKTTDRDHPSFEEVLEDFLLRKEKGEAPDPAEYIARFPQISSELRQYFEDAAIVAARIAVERREAARDGLGNVFPDRESSPQMNSQQGPNKDVLFDKFRVLEELGSGSQGVVFKAAQLSTNRIVALKVIREGLLASSKQRQRFANEVAVVSNLVHPNIATVFECGHDRGRDYFAMEYIDGESLDEFLGAHSLTVEDTIKLLLSVIDAVSYAHQRGVIHRDLKPSNIVVDREGVAHILDFGLAKQIDRGRDSQFVQEGITEPGVFAGTWHYASPEQVAMCDATVDVRTDVYAMGVILYQALTDCLPFRVRSESRDELIHAKREGAILSPSHLRREIDDDVETILLQALHQDKERRYQSMAALAEDLRSYLAGRAIAAKRDRPWYVLRKTLRRYRWQMAGGMAALLTLIIFSVTVSILYTKALNARATTQVRSDLVRRTQRILVEELSRMQFVANAMDAVMERREDLPEFAYLGRPLIDFPTEVFGRALSDLPSEECRAIRDESHAKRAEAERFIDEHGKDLDDLERVVLKSRLDFNPRPIDSNWISSFVPLHLDVGPQAVRLLADRAIMFYRNGDDLRAERSLRTARLIAYDLADSATLMHKNLAILAREYLYKIVLWLLERCNYQRDRCAPYLRWVAMDRPIPDIRYGLILQRVQMAQAAEAALHADASCPSGYLNIDELNRLTGGLYERTGLLTQELKMQGRKATTDGISAFLDRFFGAGSSSDSSRDWESDPATSAAVTALRPITPAFQSLFRNRRQAVAFRDATEFISLLIDYRRVNLKWPRYVSDVTDNDFNGSDFQYILTEEGPEILINNSSGFNDPQEDEKPTPSSIWRFFRSP